MYARIRRNWQELAGIIAVSTLFFILMWMGVIGSAKAETPIPDNPGTYVVDQTGILSVADKHRLEQRLAQFERSRTDKPQFVVLLIKDLPDQGMEAFATSVFRKWKPGQAGLDNGVLEVIHPKPGNHADVRMEVGRGIEGAIPDLSASDINRKVLGPLWVKGQYADGIIAVADTLAKGLDPVGQTATVSQEQYYQQVSKPQGASTFGAFGFFLFCAGLGGILLWLLYKAVSGDRTPKNPSPADMPGARARARVHVQDDVYLAGRAERLRKEREKTEQEWEAKVRAGGGYQPRSQPEVRPTPPKTGSGVGSTIAAGAAGAAAGMAAESALRRRREREEEDRRRRRDDDTASYGSALSGGSSSSSYDSGSSYSGGSSSSGSSDSGYSSGGGDSGGGGSSDSF